jgi:hypothetical protein
MQKVVDILCKIYNLLQRLSVHIEDEYKDSDTSVVPRANKQSGSQTIANRNDRRREVWIYNDSNYDLYISPFTQQDTTEDVFSLKIAPNDLLVMNATKFKQVYKKEIFGFWENGAPKTAKAMVTEFIMQNE